MNKKFIIPIIIILAIIAIVVILRSPEDSWICQNGQWVKHGNPSSPMPTSSCGNPEPSQEPDIVVTSPQTNQTITSPLSIEGKAKGPWYFEAVAPVKLLDDKGNILAQGQIQAQGDWMTSDYVPFKAELTFTYNSTSSGTLIFHNDNPSGLPENSKEFTVPVNLVPTQNTIVKVFFGNSKRDPNALDCNKVFPVERQIPKTVAVARAALEELIKGPTTNELSQGYFASIDPNTKIQKLTIENGIAKVDFSEDLEHGGGSCRVNFVTTEINETLKQFPTVKSVTISINGRTEDILQP